MKEIIETTWLRDPHLNDDTALEFRQLKEGLENMGLTVTWNTNIVFDKNIPLGMRLQAEVEVWTPRNTTIH